MIGGSEQAHEISIAPDARTQLRLATPPRMNHRALRGLEHTGATGWPERTPLPSGPAAALKKPRHYGAAASDIAAEAAPCQADPVSPEVTEEGKPNC